MLQINRQRIQDLLDATGKKRAELMEYMGTADTISINQLIKGDIRASKLEKLADFFHVPIDFFFDRDATNFGVQIGGENNKVHHFSVGSDANEIMRLQEIIIEKDKLIEEKERHNKTLQEMIELLKSEITKG